MPCCGLSCPQLWLGMSNRRPLLHSGVDRVPPLSHHAFETHSRGFVRPGLTNTLLGFDVLMSIPFSGLRQTQMEARAESFLATQGGKAPTCLLMGVGQSESESSSASERTGIAA